MAESEDIVVCLRPAENSPAAEVQLAAGEFLLGRTVFCIKDKFCSRRQAVITVSSKGEVTLTPKGTNPMQLKRKDEDEFAVLGTDATVTLQHGDTFTLYHKQHPVTVYVVQDQVVSGPKDLVPGVCVWMKHPGFPYWPARIANITEVGPGIRAKKGSNTHLLYFFGSHDYTWVRLPNEVSGRSTDDKRRRKSAQPNDSDRDLACGCLCWAEPEEEDGAGKKRKRSARQFVYPIHLFKCQKSKRMEGAQSQEFREAIEESIEWTQAQPEEWRFPEWVPGQDSDDEEGGATMELDSKAPEAAPPRKKVKTEPKEEEAEEDDKDHDESTLHGEPADKDDGVAPMEQDGPAPAVAVKEEANGTDAAAASTAVKEPTQEAQADGNSSSTPATGSAGQSAAQ